MKYGGDETGKYLNVPFRRLLHPHPISPPHLPRLIPPPNCPAHTHSRDQQPRARRLADPLREHRSTHHSTATDAARASALVVPASSRAMRRSSGRSSARGVTAKDGACASWLSAFSNTGERRVVVERVERAIERAREAWRDCVFGSAA